MWLNPGPGSGREPVNDYFLDKQRFDIDVDVKFLEKGPPHLEYAYYGALVLGDTIHAVKQAECDGYDGVVIGCFYDPGLYESREITERLVVTAPMEASTSIASCLGHRFSILVGRRKWIPAMSDTLTRYGLSTRLASFRPVNIGVLEMYQDHQQSGRRLLEESRKAVEEDGAEVIILGCTATRGLYRVIQDRLSVPVIDPVIASIHHVCLLAQLHRLYGWSHSKICSYEMPPREEIQRFRLRDAYKFGPIWDQMGY